ncbi:MAG TPA: hypothetical protein DDW52_26150 [Planctomycetaceae bacterium]|nr:hypothetical protein [Planctomycetaceae bacterium]
MTAFPVSTNSRPCAVLAATGMPVDLSPFCNLEFALTTESYEWTLVHTHEDWAFGGPYFVWATDIVAGNVT